MKLLCAANTLPLPADTGDCVRNLGLLRALGRAHNLTLVTTRRPISDDDDVAAVQPLLGDGRLILVPRHWEGDRRARARARRLSMSLAWRVPVAPVSRYEPAIARLLAREAPRHDAVVLLDNAVAIYWRSLRGARCSVVDVHNVSGHSLAEGLETEVPFRARARRRVELTLARSYERRWIAGVDAITVTSPDEARRLSELYGTDAAAVVPSTVDAPAQPTRNIGGRVVGWLGNLEYPPNRNGLVRFVREAWRPLGERGYELHIAGSGHEGLGAELAGYPGVRVLGFVASLDAFLSTVSVAVVPLWRGAGVKLKTVSFLAAGIPVVSTDVGLEGIGSTHGVDALVANSSETLGSALLELLADPARAEQIGAAGRNLMLQDLSWDSVGERFRQTVEATVARKCPAA